MLALRRLGLRCLAAWLLLVALPGCVTRNSAALSPEAARGGSEYEWFWAHELKEMYPRWQVPQVMRPPLSPAPAAASVPPSPQAAAAPNASPIPKHKQPPPPAPAPAPAETVGKSLPRPIIDDRANREPTVPAATESFTVVPSGAAAPRGSSNLYKVKKGDNLSSIARELYDNASAWKRIYEANREKISDPNKLQPGLDLVIP